LVEGGGEGEGGAVTLSMAIYFLALHMLIGPPSADKEYSNNLGRKGEISSSYEDRV
jgi:hypothetical protein